jgi:hypothetical protein
MLNVRALSEATRALGQALGTPLPDQPQHWDVLQIAAARAVTAYLLSLHTTTESPDERHLRLLKRFDEAAARGGDPGSDACRAALHELIALRLRLTPVDSS